MLPLLHAVFVDEIVFIHFMPTHSQQHHKYIRKKLKDDDVDIRIQVQNHFYLTY